MLKFRILIVFAFVVFLSTLNVASAERLLRPGDTVLGVLSPMDGILKDNCYFDSYLIDAEVGDLLQITQISEDFDSYLIVKGPDGRKWENDDFDPTLTTFDSRVPVLIRDSGTYEIICSSKYPDSTGEYVLTFERIERPTYFGIFVGIGFYGREWYATPLCDKDAENLRDAFISRGIMEEENTILLTNNQAKYKKVVFAFDEMMERVGPEDVFVFFFSGHGRKMESDGSELGEAFDGMNEAICLKDKDMSDDFLGSQFDRINARLTVVVVDACNSGGLARDIVAKPGRILYASSEEDVLSDLAEELNAGGFLAAFFIDAVTGGADLDGDGMVMMGELTRYLLIRYGNDLPQPESSTYGYQELVHDRGTVSQDSIFFWYDPLG